MKEFYKDIFEIANYYGYELQSNQLIEELSELTQAICKKKRVSNKFSTYDEMEEENDNLIEEIADVEIMLEQVKYLLCINQRYIEKIKMQKIERQKLRIAGEKEKI